MLGFRAGTGSRRLLRLVPVCAVLVLGVGVAAALGEENPQPIDFHHRNLVDAPAPVAGAVFGTAPSVKTGTAICTTATSTAANVSTDC